MKGDGGISSESRWFVAYSARPRWLALGGRWRLDGVWALDHALGDEGMAVRGRERLAREWSECKVGAVATTGAGLDRVTVALNSSPAKNADCSGVTVTTRPDGSADDVAIAETGG
jgi:hypothetical protein